MGVFSRRGCQQTALLLAIALLFGSASWVAPVASQGVVGAAPVGLNEFFDSVVSPALPVGWTATELEDFNNVGTLWQTATTAFDTAPNAAFVASTPGRIDEALTSPAFVVGAPGQLVFRHRFQMQPFYDGAVLEISMNNGPFTNLPAAGGSFLLGGYEGGSVFGNNPLVGEPAWVGVSPGYPNFMTTVANLPQGALGQTVRLRWRLGTQNSPGVKTIGWWIDSITSPTSAFPTLTPTSSVTPTLLPNVPEVVTNTNDSGPGSFRHAILNANSRPGAQAINFNIPTGDPGCNAVGVCTIAPLTALPNVVGPATIDGYSQPGAVVASGGLGGAVTPAVLKIELSGNRAGPFERGLFVTGASVTVRGLAINHWGGGGIQLGTSVAGQPGGHRVAGNHIGTNASGTIDLGNGGGISVAGVGNTIGGTIPGDRNVISGNDGIGIAFGGNGEHNSVVQGNFIGTDATGTQPLVNGFGGISMGSTQFSVTGTVIGGSAAGAGNLISGNEGNGITLGGSAIAPVIAGNFIGTDVTGTAPLGNHGRGVYLVRTTDALIGGNVPAARNVIAGNHGAGVAVETGATIAGFPSGAGTRIEGNYIGVDRTGSVPLGNGADGIDLAGSSATVGGATAAVRNVIAANGLAGVRIACSVVCPTNARVEGNFIGTDASGTVPLGNQEYGVALMSRFAGVSGPLTGHVVVGNVIAGSGSDGVLLESTKVAGARIERNAIGTDSSGVRNLGNAGHGILVRDGASNNTIGGTALGVGNSIAFNSGNGVTVGGQTVAGVGAAGVGVTAPTGVGILGNGVYDNGGLGIDLGEDGPTANDAGDTDTGPNLRQNAPVLVSATSGAGTSVPWTLNSTPNTAYRLEFFGSPSCDSTGAGEGRRFLGAVTTTTDGSGAANGTAGLPDAVGGGVFVAATATDPANNTSEFSACRQATGPTGTATPPPGLSATPTATTGVPNTATPGPSPSPTAVPSSNLVVNSTNDVSDGACNAAHCSLREAILAANAAPGLEGIVFAIPGTDSGCVGGVCTIRPLMTLPDVTGPVLINGYTQPGAFAASTARSGGETVGSRAAGSLRIVLDGSLAPGNASALRLLGGNSTVRGLVINRWGFSGIELVGPAGGSTVAGNYIGTDVSGTVDQGNGHDGIIVDGSPNNTIGGLALADRNVISGNDGGALDIQGAGAVGNVVLGNYLGVDASGLLPLGNGVGITVSAAGNMIGGSQVGARNVIADNGYGISTGTGTVIKGNFVGLDATGTRPLGNHGVGISADGGATIGGPDSVQRNIIAANAGHGVLLGGNGNLVDGNIIGVDVTGNVALGNGETGVFLDEVGPTEIRANVISANGGHGVSSTRLVGPVAIRGNLIGTNLAGTQRLGNAQDGINLDRGSGNTIGGVNVSERNVVSGNGRHGVRITGFAATPRFVQGNYVGVDATGTAPLGNAGSGIVSEATIFPGSGVTLVVGGEAVGAGNVVAFNARAGVAVRSVTGTRISANAIFGNVGPGIDLTDDGLTANDVGDGDGGANNLQNFPVLTSITSGNGTVVQGTLNSTANTLFRVEFFSSPTCAPSGFGPGRTYLGFASVMTNGSGDATLSNVALGPVVAGGEVVTATATDPNGNTSEFSACRAAVGPTATATVLLASATPTRTLTPSATPTATRTAAPTVTATRTPEPTPTNGLVGGRGFALQSSSIAPGGLSGAAAPSLVNLSWRLGVQQTGYLVVRWDAIANQFAFLPRFDQFLAQNATGYVDPGPLSSATYCYVLFALGGSPTDLNDIKGISDLHCVYPGSGTSQNAAGAFSVRLNEGQRAELTWGSAPNPQGYELVAIRFDGTAPRTIPLGAGETSYAENTGGQTTCYQLHTLVNGQRQGATDQICAAPGVAFFSAGAGIEDSLLRLRRALPPR